MGFRANEDFSALAMAKTINRFLLGHVLSVSRERRERKRRENIELEQIIGYDELWALCLRMPRPGWRLAGRFWDLNVFVALRLYNKKDDIGNDYGRVASEVMGSWDQYLSGQTPHRGTTIDAYIGAAYHDADETAR